MYSIHFLQSLAGISTTSEVYFYSVPDLGSLLVGAGKPCSSELAQMKTTNPSRSIVGNFTLTFALPGTLVFSNSNNNNTIMMVILIYRD